MRVEGYQMPRTATVTRPQYGKGIRKRATKYGVQIPLRYRYVVLSNYMCHGGTVPAPLTNLNLIVRACAAMQHK